MNVSDFAKYVIDNLHRASLSNALNISSKLDNDEYYTFVDFVDNIIAYVNSRLADKNIDTFEAYNILIYSNNWLKMYKSEFNYNKDMIIDNYIIDLWEIINGCKTVKN